MLADGIQKKQFQERLARVAAGGANTTSQMYAGTKEPVHKRKRYEVRKTHQEIETAPRTGASAPVSLISGLLIGAGAVVLTRFIRFRLTGGGLGGPEADILMATDIVLAITIAIILRMIFRFNSKLHGIAKLVGVVATVLLMHNTVHLAPGVYERLFSVQWVRDVIRDTEPNTILISGITFRAPQEATNQPFGFVTGR